jgi:hypothetical protein
MSEMGHSRRFWRRGRMSALGPLATKLTNRHNGGKAPEEDEVVRRTRSDTRRLQSSRGQITCTVTEWIELLP